MKEEKPILQAVKRADHQTKLADLQLHFTDTDLEQRNAASLNQYADEFTAQRSGA